MFKNENVLQEFVTRQALYCVWIRASETPGAPLVSVWVDSEMRAFEGAAQSVSSAAAAVGSPEDAPEGRSMPLTLDDIKHSI